MNVVDSSGWLEYLTKGENAAPFVKPILDVKHLLVPSICMYEVFKRLLVNRREEDALQAVGIMSHGRELPLTRKIAIDAAQLSVALSLAMADSIILATARLYDAILWTEDAHFKDIEGVQYVKKKS